MIAKGTSTDCSRSIEARKLKDESVFLYLGVLVTALSALLLGFGLWRWPRIQVPGS